MMDGGNGGDPPAQGPDAIGQALVVMHDIVSVQPGF